MNIFVLDKDPRVAARMLCDKHVPKMIVESAQMLSTAHRLLDAHQRKDHQGLAKQFKLTIHSTMNEMISIIWQFINTIHAQHGLCNQKQTMNGITNTSTKWH